MTINYWLNRRLNQTISVKTLGAPKFNSRGDPRLSTAAAVTYAARQETKIHLVTNQQGDKIVSRGLVYVGLSTAGEEPSIAVTDVVTLPDGSAPPILFVDTLRDRDSTNHQVLHYG